MGEHALYAWQSQVRWHAGAVARAEPAAACMGTHGAAPPPHARSRAGFSVVALGRSPTRGSEVLREMRAAGGGQHEYISCDAFSLQNLAQAAADIRASHKAVDVLVLSQGMATIQVCHANTARVHTRTFTRRRTHKNNRTKKNPHPPNHPHRKTDRQTHTHTHAHTGVHTDGGRQRREANPALLGADGAHQ